MTLALLPFVSLRAAAAALRSAAAASSTIKDSVLPVACVCVIAAVATCAVGELWPSAAAAVACTAAAVMRTAAVGAPLPAAVVEEELTALHPLFAVVVAAVVTLLAELTALLTVTAAAGCVPDIVLERSLQQRSIAERAVLLVTACLGLHRLKSSCLH